MRKHPFCGALACALFAFTLNQPMARAAILGIEWDTVTGKLYSINTSNAAMTLIGDTGVPGFAGLEFAPDGTLYGFTGSGTALASLYTINPATAAATFIGNLGLAIPTIPEGALAFSPAGVAYGTNLGGPSNPGLFTLNLTTGAATLVANMSGNHDINGLAWRSDGMLVGLDRTTNFLVTIDPATAAIANIGSGVPGGLGSVGGMTVQDGVGYYATGGPDNPFPGTSQLYSFNLFTGATSLIGTFSPAITAAGISGLAAPVPEPATLAFFALGASLLLKRRR